jgi:hypothetical protein
LTAIVAITDVSFNMANLLWPLADQDQALASFVIVRRHSQHVRCPTGKRLQKGKSRLEKGKVKRRHPAQREEISLHEVLRSRPTGE